MVNPGIWTLNPSEPRTKVFNYTIRINCTDSFGNVYPEVQSLIQGVAVSVSSEKEKWQQGALSAKGLAVQAAICTLGVLSGPFDALAAGLGAKALDPPEPDPLFRKQVHLASRTTQDALHGSGDEHKLLLILRLAEHCMACVDALSIVENRLLGARESYDQIGIDRQTDSYRAFERTLQETIAELLAVTKSSIASLKNSKEFAPEVLASTIRLWQRQGMPREIQERLSKDGCSAKTIANILSAIEDPTVAAISQHIDRLVTLLTRSLCVIGLTVHHKLPDVLGTERTGWGDNREKAELRSIVGQR